jgi:hypothetical protein
MLNMKRRGKAFNLKLRELSDASLKLGDVGLYLESRISVSSPGGKWAEQVAEMLFWEKLSYCCRILPKATSDARSTIWYKRIRSHLSSEGLRYSIADAKAQTILLNRMDCG